MKLKKSFKNLLKRGERHSEKKLPATYKEFNELVINKLESFIDQINANSNAISDPEQKKAFDSKHKYIRNLAIELKASFIDEEDYYESQVRSFLKTDRNYPVYGKYLDISIIKLNNAEKKGFSSWGGDVVMKDLRATIDEVQKMLDEKEKIAKEAKKGQRNEEGVIQLDEEDEDIEEKTSSIP